MKRLIFISSFDYPSRYAHAIHGLYMARAFHKALGDGFLFFVNTSVDDTLAAVPHRLLFGRFGRRIKKMHLRRAFIPLVLLRFFLFDSFSREKGLAVFAIDSELIPMLAVLKRFFNFSFMFEIHRILSPRLERTLARSADTLVFITQALKTDFLSRHPDMEHRCIVAPEAVDVAGFLATPNDAKSLRRELNLPEEGTLVGYIGRFEPLDYDKGLLLMIEATRDMPQNIRVILVGGSREEIANYTARIASLGLSLRITLVPHVATALVPRYAKACDILAYVPPAGSVFFEKETSPMKLFEYMAAKRPIIVSDLPTTREILSDDSAFFIPAGSRDAFIRAVERIESDAAEAAHRVAQAFQRVEHNTWEARAELILAGSMPR